MSDIAIRVENLSKRYVINHQRQGGDGLRHALQDKLTAPWRALRKLGKRKAETGNHSAFNSQLSAFPPSGSQLSTFNSSSEEFWALRDVSFEVKRGEVVGIIGRNGAGKSTLLKILSRITEPTTGRITIEGRVASLLEVGTGFHPELTGRENIFLNGAILGMSRAEIKAKFDEIVAFAEVERFLDTPVKRYSSGMYVRLAFAVAAHLEPEILIVDEVLAVGDAQFQRKCLGKMQDVSQQEGRTILFVSHNMPAVVQLTKKALVMEKGKLTFVGTTEAAVDFYGSRTASEDTTVFEVENSNRKHPGTQSARILSLRFQRSTPVFKSDEDFVFHAQVRASEDIPALRFSMTILNGEGVPVGSCFSGEVISLARGGETSAIVCLPRPRLAPGHYYCGVSIGKGNHRTGHVDFDVVLDTLQFEVQPAEGEGGTVSSWSRSWGSIVFPPLHVEGGCDSMGRAAVPPCKS
jgi:lipopolysaccharide transport system ATP-binding protein